MIPVSPPQLPRDESLQCGIALVHESATSRATERQSLPEYQRLAVVEYVALAIVRCGRSGRLVPKLRTPLDRQGLSIRFSFARLVIKFYTEMNRICLKISD